MFDNLINGIKGYFPDRLIQFAISGLIAMLLYQLVGGALDVMGLAHFVVEIAVAGLLAFAVAGAARG
jgi:hypothetical protein